MKKILTVVGMVIAVATINAGQAFAQSSGVEEVTVTAQRRSQNAQDVGMSITAYSGDQINSMGVSNSADLVQITPGLRSPKSNSNFTLSFSIRGLSQNDYGASQEAPVALYVDDVYYASQSAAAFDLFDIDRVEVLRGPQGTLYGRNATGGLVHFITRLPESEAGGYADISYGRFNEVKAQGAVDIPVSDDLALRISGGGDWHDPLVKNTIGPSLWNGNSFGLRFQSLYTPNDNVSFLLNLHMGRRREVGQPWLWAAARPIGPAGTGVFTPGLPDYFGYTNAGNGPFRVSLDPISMNHADSQGATGTFTWNLGGATLTSVTDYEHLNVRFHEDSDMQPGEFFHFYGAQKVDQVSQEVRVNGDSDNLHWVTGLYYLHVSGNFLQSGHIADLGYGVGSEDTIYSTKTDSASVFGQAEFKLSDQFRAITGARYIWEHKSEGYDSSFRDVPGGTKIGFGSSPDLLVFNGESNSGLFALKGELDWVPDENHLVYASYNRGVKAGGFNAPLDPSGSSAFIDPITFNPAPTADAAMRFKPETLHAFEIGSKNTFLGGNAHFNIAAFYYDYKDFQAFNFSGISTSYIQNRNARLDGVDADLEVSPLSGLQIALGASYLNQIVYDVEVGSATLNRSMPYAPKWNLTGLVKYDWNALGGTMSAQANANYVSSEYFALSNAPVTYEPGYTLVNARLSYTFANYDLSLAAFVDNLTDKRYRTIAFDLASSFGSVENQIGFPRTYGIELRYGWGGE